MTSLTEASFALARERLRRHHAGQPTSIDEIEIHGVDEEPESAIAYVMFAGADSWWTKCFDRPEPFDAEQCVAMLCDLDVTVH